MIMPGDMLVSRKSAIESFQRVYLVVAVTGFNASDDKKSWRGPVHDMPAHVHGQSRRLLCRVVGNGRHALMLITIDMHDEPVSWSRYSCS